jgi:HAD superfamily phosphatase (TIGR01668 family)
MSLFRPDEYFTSVGEIDLDRLRHEGIEALIVDLDNTLLPRDSGDVPAWAAEWAGIARESFGVCLVSNNWHERVRAVADELGVQLVSRALKPLPFAFRRALGLLEADASRTAVVGDQVFTDVLGGNLVGARTILVEPLSRSDLPHTLLLRRLEHRIMAGRRPSA